MRVRSLAILSVLVAAGCGGGERPVRHAAPPPLCFRAWNRRAPLPALAELAAAAVALPEHRVLVGQAARDEHTRMRCFVAYAGSRSAGEWLLTDGAWVRLQPPYPRWLSPGDARGVSTATVGVDGTVLVAR
jgi:hypothetical protein